MAVMCRDGLPPQTPALENQPGVKSGPCCPDAFSGASSAGGESMPEPWTRFTRPWSRLPPVLTQNDKPSELDKEKDLNARHFHHTHCHMGS